MIRPNKISFVCYMHIGNQHLLQADSMWRELLQLYEENGCVLNADVFPWKTTECKYKAAADDAIVRFEEKLGFEREDIPYTDSNNYNYYEASQSRNHFQNDSRTTSEQHVSGAKRPAIGFMPSNNTHHAKVETAQKFHNVNIIDKQITVNTHTVGSMQNENVKVPIEDKFHNHYGIIQGGNICKDNVELNYYIDDVEYPPLPDSNGSAASKKKD